MPAKRRSSCGFLPAAIGERDDAPTRLLPEDRLRVFQKRTAPLPEAGWAVVVRHRIYGANAMAFVGCDEVTLENVTVHAAPGMAVYAQECRDLTIRRLRVIPAAGGWMSTTADALHCNACRGTIVVEDCEFTGMGGHDQHPFHGRARDDAARRSHAGDRLRPHARCGPGPQDLGSAAPRGRAGLRVGRRLLEIRRSTERAIVRVEPPRLPAD